MLANRVRTFLGVVILAVAALAVTSQLLQAQDYSPSTVCPSNHIERTESRVVWQINGWKCSFFEVREPELPGATATFFFQNEIAHSSDELFSVSLNGETYLVTVDYQAWGTNGEEMHVTPPEGCFVSPNPMFAEEGESITAHLFCDAEEMS